MQEALNIFKDHVRVNWTQVKYYGAIHHRYARLRYGEHNAFVIFIL